MYRYIAVQFHQFRLCIVVCVLTLSTLLLVGCGPKLEPTPTPTKTPIPNEVMLAEPTATPPAPTTTSLPIEATDTPMPAPSELSSVIPANIAPYTGLPVSDPTALLRAPILICVNNDAVGRAAHFGLSQADIIYEYIVDGFVGTRLSALYQSQEAERIGPVRSARLPNIWMTYMYDGVLACSGGSDEVRYLLKNEVDFPYLDADIDDPSNNRYFFSIGTDYRTRMQASTEGVRRWLSDNGLLKVWSRSGFEFSQEPPGSQAGTATSITIPYPGGNQVEWRYDPSQNGYIRFQGGQQQFDQATDQPIVAQNVIAVVASHEETDIIEDSFGTKSIDIQLYDFGDFRIFRDGAVYEGTWRADPENSPRWLGPGEVIVKLKPGQSWIQVVRSRDEINY